MKASVKTHPKMIYARMHNEVSLVLRVENQGNARWVEAEVHVPEKLSLASDTGLHKGRMRVGIVENDESLEKTVKIYASAYTDAQEYPCTLTVFTYDKDGVIDERIDVQFTLKAEEQKPSVL